jgi:hypothetical protein
MYSRLNARVQAPCMGFMTLGFDAHGREELREAHKPYGMSWRVADLASQEREGYIATAVNVFSQSTTSPRGQKTKRPLNIRSDAQHWRLESMARGHNSFHQRCSHVRESEAMRRVWGVMRRRFRPETTGERRGQVGDDECS